MSDKAADDLAVFKALVRQTTPEDYDGHTEFARMTPAQRIAWLDQAVLFIASRKPKESAWRVAEEK